MPRVHPYIKTNPKIANGRAFIEGTRLEISQIVLEYLQFGWSPDQIVEADRRLTLAQVHDALSYYYENQVELDAELAAERELAGELSSQYPSKVPPRSAALTTVWVFDGTGATFPSGVFSTYEAAHEWITKNSLYGTLTEYPVDISAYDWAIKRGVFKPKREEHFASWFIQRFSSASQNHYHYVERAAEEAPQQNEEST